MSETSGFIDSRIGVIGAGVMGCTLIKGMLDSGLLPPDQIHATVQSAKSRERVHRELGVEVAIRCDPARIARTDVFLICTKPYRVADVLKELKRSGGLKPGVAIISIAAGVSIAAMEAILPEAAVIRAMPNTPCRVGAGATAIAPGNRVLPQHLELANRIFSAVGVCVELDERHLNAVTAVSGSGPAYIYLIMEALADGAVQVGLPRETAFQLVSQTMLGAAIMLQKSGKHPAMLKDEVTTPAGCTISALLTMEDGKIRSILARAVEAATRTASLLGSGPED